MVNAGDDLWFESAVPGRDAEPPLYEVVPFADPGNVLFHDNSYFIGTRATVNGEPAQPEQKLKHHDRVETVEITALGDLIRDCGESIDKIYLVNGKPAGLDTLLKDGDRITSALPPETPPPIESIDFRMESNLLEDAPMEGVPVENEPTIAPTEKDAVEENQQEPLPEQEPVKAVLHVTLNHDFLSLPEKPDGAPYYLVDMLNLVDMDLSKPEGRQIVIKINGKDAAYLQLLEDGDTIDIHWDGAPNTK